MNTVITSLLLALGVISAEQPAPRLDIPYFLDNPEVRAETLRRCHNDYALARTPECENAEAASTRTMGRPLSSWHPDEIPLLVPPPKRQAPPAPVAPVLAVPKGEERGA